MIKNEMIRVMLISLFFSCLNVGAMKNESMISLLPEESVLVRYRKNDGITYKPGALSVKENGLLLSRGLKSKILAISGKEVGSTNKSFLSRPDGAGCFEDGEGWVYTINSEEDDGEGGVGGIYFYPNGEIEDYKMLLKKTTRNCSGGKTFWNTWVSCEEYDNGQCWEVDPYDIERPKQTMIGGVNGGKFESFAYDNRNPLNLKAFVTEDYKEGALRRYSPKRNVLRQAIQTNDYSKVLTQKNGGKIEYLVLNPKKNKNSGTFSWTLNEKKGRRSALQYYQNAEGIDVKDGILFFAVKRDKRLFILDLDKFEYRSVSTESGLFDGQPDQVIIQHKTDILYFTEDSRSSGIHAQDETGKFFTVIDSSSYGSETTGLAFSPDMEHLYFCVQVPGVCFDIVRRDKRKFTGKALNIRYHRNGKGPSKD